jgi:hypothetical protein
MMFSTVQKTVMILFALASLAACSSAKNMSAARNASDVGAVGNQTSVNGVSCKGNSGRIYDGGTAGASGTFEQRIKGLVSATVDPSYFGSIDGSMNSTQTCVAFEGRLNTDASGNVNVSQSNLKITVYDSYVGTADVDGGTIEPYVIQFSAASSGQVNASGKTFSIQFKDEYGEINLSGSFAQATTTGTMNFKNYKSFDNASSPASALLGAFSIPTASFVR